jgi:hypothetical protein
MPESGMRPPPPSHLEDDPRATVPGKVQGKPVGNLTVVVSIN